MSNPYRSHSPAVPTLRDDDGAEPCERCGLPTKERLMPKGRRNQPQLMIECPRCGQVRPASDK